MSWTVALYNLTENATLNETINQTLENVTQNFTFHINSTYNIQDYRMTVYVTDNSTLNANSTGNISFNFSITNIFYPYFTAPSSSVKQTPESSLNPSPVIRVNYSRNETLEYNITVNLNCPQPSTYNMTLVKSGNLTYEMNSSNTSHFCKAATGYSTSFGIYLNVSDGNGNSGTGVLSLTTESQSSPGGNSPGGGGGLIISDDCNCTEWINSACWKGDCGFGMMYQTRICDPAGCSNESQCISDPICEANRDFSFTTQAAEFDVFRGDDASVILTTENTGDDVLLNISLSIDSGNLSVFSPEYYEVNASGALDLTITVHTMLNQSLGAHFVTIIASDLGVEKNKTIKINILENPLLENLDELQSQLDYLNQKISEYSESGMDISGLQNLAEQIETSLENARTNIEEDNLSGLQSDISIAGDNMAQANSSLTTLGIISFIFEYKYWIILAIIIIVIASFFVTEIGWPYYKISSKLKKMRQSEKTQVQGRIVTEKSFFMGKNDRGCIQQDTHGEANKDT